MTAILTLGAVAVLTAADQLIKYFIIEKLAPIGTQMLIPGVLQLHYTENTGAMMGLLGGQTVLMSIAACILIAVLLYLIFSKKIKPGFFYGCLTIILAGGLGNLIDRIFRGFVVDYIEVLFVNFYIFNFADCLITVGAFAAAIYELYDFFRTRRQSQENNHG